MERMQASVVGGGIAVIEVVEVGGQAERGLTDHQPFRRPPVKRVTRRRQDALLEIVAWVQPEKRVGEVSIAVVYLPIVLRCARTGRVRRQHAERAYLAAVEPRQHGHPGLLATFESVHDLVRQHVAVHSAERREARRRGPVGDCLGIHRAQAGDVGGAEPVHQRLT